jgi:ribosomal protein S1
MYLWVWSSPREPDTSIMGVSPGGESDWERKTVHGEVVPEFVEVEVAVLRPEPACGRLGLSAKTMKEDRG